MTIQHILNCLFIAVEAIHYLITLFFLQAMCTACPAQQPDETTRFKKEIPTWSDGSPNLFYNLSQQKAKQLRLDTLQGGFDSLQIRIWYDYSLIDLRRLFIITCSKSVWTATVYDLRVKWNHMKLTETIRRKKKTIINPKNSWASFREKLFALQVTTLPNMEDIPGLNDGWTDGVSYHVEVASQQLYRFYSYHLPDKFQDKYWQAKNMVDILNLIEQEFGFVQE